VLEGFIAAPDEQTRVGLLSLNSYIGTPVIKRQMDRLVEGMYRRGGWSGLCGADQP
jgi:hypothetical protein